MQTNIELAGASGRVIGLPVSARREQQTAVVERPAKAASLFAIVKEAKQTERLETMVWIAIAIAAVVLLVLSFVILGKQPATTPVGEWNSKRQRTAALQDLAEEREHHPSRQRLGVRLSSAAFLTPDP